MSWLDYLTPKQWLLILLGLGLFVAGLFWVVYNDPYKACHQVVVPTNESEFNNSLYAGCINKNISVDERLALRNEAEVEGMVYVPWWKE